MTTSWTDGPSLIRSVEDIREGIQHGRFPARVFNDQEIYDLEQERLFYRTWCFLAHETEIPSPGDYVTRYIGNNNIIVARDEHGQITANLNMCRHRGNVLCKSELGNASHFRCSFHGWTYKNSGELIGVPYMKEGYEGRLKRKDWGLVNVRVDSYAGLVFGCLDPGTPSLEDYLGGFQFYLDLYLKQGAEGSEVHGPPDHWVADTDWKICAENFAGDGYHTPVAHQFGFNLGYFPSSGATHSRALSKQTSARLARPSPPTASDASPRWVKVRRRPSTPATSTGSRRTSRSSWRSATTSAARAGSVPTSIRRPPRPYIPPMKP